MKTLCRLFCAGLLVSMGALSPACWAQSANRSANSAALFTSQFKERLQEMKVRLNLTADQETRIRPLLEEELDQLRLIARRYAGDPSRQAREDRLNDAWEVQEDFHAKLTMILTSKQMGEWNTMRDEFRTQAIQLIQQQGTR